MDSFFITQVMFPCTVKKNYGKYQTKLLENKVELIDLGILLDKKKVEWSWAENVISGQYRFLCLAKIGLCFSKNALKLLKKGPTPHSIQIIDLRWNKKWINPDTVITTKKNEIKCPNNLWKEYFMHSFNKVVLFLFFSFSNL